MTFLVVSVFPAPDSPLFEEQEEGQLGRPSPNPRVDARNEDALRLSMSRHPLPCLLGHSEDMRRISFSSAAFVLCAKAKERGQRRGVRRPAAALTGDNVRCIER